MELNDIAETTLRLYALGQLDEERRLELEERLVTDPETFEALGVIEQELIEEYLDNTLANGDRKSFEQHYLTTPDRTKEVGFVRLLRQHAAARPREAQRFVAGRFAWLVAYQHVWAGGMAAALVVAIGSALWFASGRQRLQQQVVQLQSAYDREQRERQDLQGRLSPVAPAAVDVTGLGPADREKAIAAVKEKLTALSAQLQQQASQTSPVFSLTPGLQRADGRLTRIVIPANASIVKLRLELPANEYALYRAVLYDSQSQELLAQSQLKAEGTGERRAVTLALAPALLGRGDYQVKLSGVGDRGEPAAVASYSLRVLNPQ
jgi:hypothetical protein